MNKRKKAAIKSVGFNALAQMAMIGLGALAASAQIALDQQPGVIGVSNAAQSQLPPARKPRTKRLKGGGDK